MGNCWGSSAVEKPITLSSTKHFNSGISNTSQSTSITSSSNVSSKSQFSVSSSDEAYPNGHILPTPNLREFTFQELKTAARNFKSDTFLGEGGFGRVYKGWLENKHPSKSGSGLVVAIKKLNSESVQGFEEWQSDVYGFGVVLVELLTGLRALDTNRPSNKHKLVDWIKPYLSEKRKLKSVMDSRFEGKYPSKAATATAGLALKCLAQEPRARPSMQEVVETLEKIQAMDHEKPKVSRTKAGGNASVRPHGHPRKN
ncbi:putative serine/threonine-protein kinase PIX13, partial [Bienertia sinuspersici]